ncbi:hypothetical protein EYE40_02600 [Glaciihabitans arcticus]|uniref:DNA uptake lipoprotein n=1 Tax=Glaciihabitans arcticus TaxID=2668039 RepID=A0A4Q9GNW1_9MICO|nr:hypothetical protein [Glaciihabitans arcticus]TBN56375.1 hypothetical protein EYE40_02600 [Glaciihabitans arcticus]
MSTTTSSRSTGAGRVLIAVYAVLALAATGRSFVQIATDFDDAPIAYSLSALAAVVYILATIALIKKGDTWYRIAWITISFELLGVLVVGALSLVDPILFPAKTVWSVFGAGYLFVPLVLPIFGMIFLYRKRPRAAEETF